jgi:hypothetical protein
VVAAHTSTGLAIGRWRRASTTIFHVTSGGKNSKTALTSRKMVWFFERQGAFIRCETRDALDGDGFELVIIHPDGKEQIERFRDSALLIQRQSELESFFNDHGWAGPFGRTI